MRSVRRSDRGLSEIVGTLMLIVIVVAAATLLAAFVASYQKQLQTEESYSHDQSLESIHVLGLNTTVNSGGTAYTSFSLTIASAYVNPSGIYDIFINGQPLKQFGWLGIENGTRGQYDTGDSNNPLILSPFQQEMIILNVNPLSPAFSFFNASELPLPNQYLVFGVLTQLGNDFTRSFLPPVPLILASENNPTGESPFTLLDGSTSFQPGGNATLVDWAWTVSSAAVASTSTSTTDATWSTPNGELTNGTVSVTGAQATLTVPTGFAWSWADDYAAFSFGNNLSVTETTGTGCVVSDQSVTGVDSATPGPSSTLNLVFNFTASVSGCSSPTPDASLSLAETGATIVSEQAPLAVIVTAIGEEYEVSPALPTLYPLEYPYTINLVVTNSDGLDGSASYEFTPPQ